jgi:DNA-binding NtrC family response regulator
MAQAHQAKAMEGRDTILGMSSGLRALVIDDDRQVCGLVAEILRNSNWHVTEAYSEKECRDLMPREDWDLIICDVMLGDADGYSILREYREQGKSARFVLITGQGSAAGALDATAIGAFDYITKPFSVEDILKVANSVRDRFASKSDKRRTERTPEPAGYKSDIPLIGKSPRFVECLKMVGRVATSDLPVLITGESGTGKEVVAKAIHRRSKRAGGPFVAVNCGAIPVELIESELFGHAKGSFTGADRERPGLWENANEGTIFLDEITETSLLFQVKLLRALQENEVRRIGSDRSINVDVRVVAATNRDIEEEVRLGRFRQDLMFRLNAITIQLPPLRERAEDIPLLAVHFLESNGGGPADGREISSAALVLLERYDWPGNIRELENAILHAMSLSDGAICPEHLPKKVQEVQRGPAVSNKSDEKPGSDEARWMTLAEMETEYVLKVLRSTGNNKQAASRILDIDRKTLTRIAGRASGDQS